MHVLRISSQVPPNEARAALPPVPPRACHPASPPCRAPACCAARARGAEGGARLDRQHRRHDAGCAGRCCGCCGDKSSAKVGQVACHALVVLAAPVGVRSDVSDWLTSNAPATPCCPPEQRNLCGPASCPQAGGCHSKPAAAVRGNAPAAAGAAGPGAGRTSGKCGRGRRLRGPLRAQKAAANGRAAAAEVWN